VSGKEIAQNEEKTIETFLSAVYYPGDDSHKLEDSFLQTIWISGKPGGDGNIGTIKNQTLIPVLSRAST